MRGSAPTVTSVERLSQGFHETFETLTARGDVFAEDAFFDLNMPVWRFQLQGREAFAEQLAKISQGPSRVEILRTEPTASGFVTEHVEHQDVDGADHFARRMWLCTVSDGVIAEAVGYCSGDWDPELAARHATEAPMLRP